MVLVMVCWPGVVVEAYMPTTQQCNAYGGDQLWVYVMPHAECPAGSFPVGWGCHICPERTYNSVPGSQQCTQCPEPGLVTAEDGTPMRGRILSAHDTASDCRTGEVAPWAFTNSSRQPFH